MSDKQIEIKNVTFSYGDGEEKRNVLENFSLDIERGSFTVILGHNGSGKSTVAKLMNGLYKPSGESGKVLVDGIDTRGSEHEIEIRRKVGMVFQNPDNQLVASVVEEDVAFGPENLGLKREEIRARVDEALKAVGMFEFRKSTPHHLSGGQKQRVAIAGVIVMRPECLILDEPTAMLDPKGRAEVMDIITRFNRENGMTVVLITHFMEEAEPADRVLLLNDGEIISDGKPKEIFSDIETLKKAGLDVPQTTELLFELKQNGMDIDTDAISVEETAARITAALHLEEK
ncbi:MAG: energy-coupling factor transporter ATPase [Clostridia bacterium]|nr:energy-coupling factor transporter ATPase [Clostridia bacterium]